MQHQPFILLQHISFNHPSGKPLFADLSFQLRKQKIGLIGKNGVGKTTLMKCILSEVKPNTGSVVVSGKLAHVPQNPQLNDSESVASILGIQSKLNALTRITAGSTDEKDYVILNDDWNLADRLHIQLKTFGLEHIAPLRQIHTLSGGEVTRLLLAKAFFSEADFVLLDEPTNHLDLQARNQLYTIIEQSKKGLLVISHDRDLLNRLDCMLELTSLGVNNYGGNYDHYMKQKSIEIEAAKQAIQARKEILQTAKESTQCRRERHEQNEARGRSEKKSQIKAKGSYDKIQFNSAKGRSEATNRRIRLQAERKINSVEAELQQAKESLEVSEKIDIFLPATSVPNGKMIVEVEDLSFQYPGNEKFVFEKNNFSIQGPERVALLGTNGSGKTTFIKLLLKQLKPHHGKIIIGTPHVCYLDQNASLLNPNLSVLENFKMFNNCKQNEAYAALAQFLFRNVSANRIVKELSGGEKLRAVLACVLMQKHPPQLLILDEPTNHLDLSSVQSLESALQHYLGAMIVISHDRMFLENINVERYVNFDSCSPE